MASTKCAPHTRVHQAVSSFAASMVSGTEFGITIIRLTKNNISLSRRHESLYYLNLMPKFLIVSLIRFTRNPMGPTVTKGGIILDALVFELEAEVGINGKDQCVQPSANTKPRSERHKGGVSGPY